MDFYQDPDAGPVYADRSMPGGKHAWVIPLLGERARIVVGKRGDDGVYDGW